MGIQLKSEELVLMRLWKLIKGHASRSFWNGYSGSHSLIKELKYKEFIMEFDVDTWKTAPELKSG